MADVVKSEKAIKVEAEMLKLFKAGKLYEMKDRVTDASIITYLAKVEDEESAQSAAMVWWHYFVRNGEQFSSLKDYLDENDLVLGDDDYEFPSDFLDMTKTK
jgi:hypothetical protein